MATELIRNKGVISEGEETVGEGRGTDEREGRDGGRRDREAEGKDERDGKERTEEGGT